VRIILHNWKPPKERNETLLILDFGDKDCSQKDIVGFDALNGISSYVREFLT
jgi:hypothetical protein